MKTKLLNEIQTNANFSNQNKKKKIKKPKTNNKSLNQIACPIGKNLIKKQ